MELTPIPPLMPFSPDLDTEMLRYLLNNDTTPAAHLWGLARELASLDRRFEPLADVKHTAECFYKLIAENLFWPSPVILLEGAKAHPVLFNSTALALSDSFDDIFETLKRASILLQNRIQVGLDFSYLRAARSAISTSHLQSVGPVRFMELFERTPQASDAKTPLRFLINVDHQDIEAYLEYAQTSPAHVRHALGVTPAFLEALETGSRMALYHKKNAEPAADIPAQNVFKAIMRVLAKGVVLDFIFLDHLHAFRRDRAIPDAFLLNTQNQLVAPGELMATGAVNLAPFASENGIDEAGLARTLEGALHFLDNCFEKNLYVDEGVKEATKEGRRVGLAVLGMDTFLRRLLPLPDPQRYGKLIAHTAALLQTQLIRASQRLGEKRGLKSRVSFGADIHSTRNRQLLSQIHLPLLSQIANTPSYLFRKEMAVKDFIDMYPLHLEWQRHLGNVASLKHPLKGMNLATLTKLLLHTHKSGMLTFELTAPN